MAPRPRDFLARGFVLHRPFKPVAARLVAGVFAGLVAVAACDDPGLEAEGTPGDTADAAAESDGSTAADVADKADSSAPADSRGANEPDSSATADAASADVDINPADTNPLDIDSVEPCNGHAALCFRRVDRVAFAGTHNAMASQEAGFIAPNHKYGLKRQLDDGVRAMLLDTHAFFDPTKADVKTWLCHGNCLLGRTPLRDGLKVLDDFLAAHPREVLVLIFQDGIKPAELATAMTESGLADRIYKGVPAKGWPTLGELIAKDERVIVTAEHSGPPPAWHHRFWDLGWDTPYSFKSMAALQAAGGKNDSCRRNRGTTAGSLFLLNHWLSTSLGLPDTKPAATTNSKAVLGKRAQRCRDHWQHVPNVVAGDYHHAGDLIAVVDALNGF